MGMVNTRTWRWRWLSPLLVLALVAGACGDDDDGDAGSDTTVAEQDGDTGTETETATETADGLTPVPEGVDLDATLNMSYSVGPTELDPDRSRTAGDNTYFNLWFDRLTEINNDLEVVPMLATEWSYSEDGTTFDMTLRDDVTFHDGTPFNADAVVANIERSKTLEGSTSAASIADVESVEAVSEFEVRFNLPEAKPANLPVLLAGNVGAMISPAYFEDATADLVADLADIGSGPYRAVEWQPNQSVRFERAPDFWDPGRQLLAELTISQVGPEARINGVRSGEFDLGQSAATDAVEAISIGESGAFEYHVEVINTVYGALFNPGSEGDLANQQVRQAIMHAMDRDALNEGLFEGECEPRFQPFDEDSRFYTPEIEERYPHDLDRARDLIEESGITNPSFDIDVSPGSYEPMAQVMQAQLAEVGITMNIVPTETAASPVNFITGASPSIYLVVLAQPDLGTLYANWYGGPFANLLNAEVPEAAAIHEAAAAANDASLSEEEQIEAWQDIFIDVQELAVFAPSCAAPQVWMHDESVIGVEEMPYIWSGAVVPYTLGVLAD